MVGIDINILTYAHNKSLPPLFELAKQFIAGFCGEGIIGLVDLSLFGSRTKTPSVWGMMQKLFRSALCEYGRI